MISEYFPADARHYVRDELELRQSRRPQYSLRAFARDLDMSASFLCEFLHGRQGMSRDRVYWIAEKLKLNIEQRDHFWDLVESKFGRTVQSKKAATFRAKDRFKDPGNRLSRDRFLAIADWYHFVLLELLTVNPKFPTATMAEKLGVSDAEVQTALTRLVKLGLLGENPDGGGGWKVLEEESVVGGAGADSAVQAAHEHTLKKHLEFCSQKDYAQRENVSLSFSIAESQWPDLRREIQKAVLQVISKHGNSALNKDQVVSFTMQMVTLL